MYHVLVETKVFYMIKMFLEFIGFRVLGVSLI